MSDHIHNLLNETAATHGVRILYACESGSRAWGFPSPDSDYDIRFIYAHPKDWYLSIAYLQDTIELPIDEMIDMNGWDVRKALQLLRKSNSPLLEWLSSPIVYSMDEQSMSACIELANRAFLPETSCHHYLSMARGSIAKFGDTAEVKIKTYMYALRAALCSQWIVQRLSQPPMRIQELLPACRPDARIMSFIDDLIELKGKSVEKSIIERSYHFEDYLRDMLRHAGDNIPKNREKLAIDEFDRVFRKALSDR